MEKVKGLGSGGGQRAAGGNALVPLGGGPVVAYCLAGKGLAEIAGRGSGGGAWGREVERGGRDWVGGVDEDGGDELGEL